MATLQRIKKRLAGTNSIRQMTEAMELVAATKMRRAQETALATRPYAFTAVEILADVVQYLESEEGAAHRGALSSIRFLSVAKVDKIAVVLVASDRGLAGSFNASVFRRLERYLRDNPDATPEKLEFVAVGQKSADYLKRQKFRIAAQFVKFGDIATIPETEPLSNYLIENYLAGAFDQVLVFSMHFFSALKQEVIIRQLLPIDYAHLRATIEEIIPETGRYAELRREIIAARPASPIDYIVEPSPEETLNHIFPLLLKMRVYHFILEANASEHSARRVAMKNASDNAKELIFHLTLEYNRQRQEGITNEVSEIASTTAALKK